MSEVKAGAVSDITLSSIQCMHASQTSKYQDNYEFYVVRQKSPLFLGPCCGQTNGPFLAFKGSN